MKQPYATKRQVQRALDALQSASRLLQVRRTADDLPIVYMMVSFALEAISEVESAVVSKKVPEPLLLYRLSEQFQKKLVDYTLDRLDGNQVQSARFLGISRNKLRSLMSRHVIRVPIRRLPEGVSCRKY